MTVLNFGVQPAPGVSALIFCNSCGDVSIETPAFGWKCYLRTETTCHHCPSCQEFNDLIRVGVVHDRPAKDAVIYTDWPGTTPP